MKQSQPQRKPRPRSNNRKPGSRPQSNSGRVENRVRGNPKQLLDKYKTQARESHQGGDRIQSEFYLQFADHYQRVMNEMRLGCGGVFEDYREVALRPAPGPAPEISDDDSVYNPYADNSFVDPKTSDGTGESSKKVGSPSRKIDGEQSVSSDTSSVRKQPHASRERLVRRRPPPSGDQAGDGLSGTNTVSASSDSHAVKSLAQDQSGESALRQGPGPSRRQRAEVAEQSEHRQRRPYRSRDQNRAQNSTVSSEEGSKDLAEKTSGIASDKKDSDSQISRVTPVSTAQVRPETSAVDTVRAPSSVGRKAHSKQRMDDQSLGLSDEKVRRTKAEEGIASPKEASASPKEASASPKEASASRDTEENLPRQSAESATKPLRRRMPGKPSQEQPQKSSPKPPASDSKSPEAGQAVTPAPETEVKPKRRGRPRKVDVQAALALEAKSIPREEKSSVKKPDPAPKKKILSNSGDNSDDNSGGGGVTKENAA